MLYLSKSSGQLFPNGGFMFEVTAKATEMMKEVLKEEKKDSAIRVIYNEGG